LIQIRDFDEKTHLAGVRACLIELQDFERALDHRLPSGAAIVDDLIAHMLNRCTKCDGRVVVGELNEEVVGFATILAKVKSEELSEGEIEYGLVSELVVASEHRKQGIGRKLLKAAESYAESNGVKRLRIGVLAANHSADELYESMGFKSFYIEREKELPGP
jgi:GNAT superfamily N-acetyltransferase